MIQFCDHCGVPDSQAKGVYFAYGEDGEGFICFECLAMEEREEAEVDAA